MSGVFSLPRTAHTHPEHDEAVDPHGDRTYSDGELATAISDHEADTDPHGDRAYADGLVDTLVFGAGAMHPRLTAALTQHTSAGFYQGWALDAATAEGAGVMFLVPDGWATIDVDIWWTNNGAGSGNVVWRPGYDSLADGGSLGVTAGSTSTIAAPASTAIKKSTILTGLSVTPGRHLLMVAERRAADAADTLGNDALLLSIVVRKAS